MATISNEKLVPMELEAPHKADFSIRNLFGLICMVTNVFLFTVALVLTK